MAVLLKEKGKYTVLSNATIQGEFGSNFQITGMQTPFVLDRARQLIGWEPRHSWRDDD